MKILRFSFENKIHYGLLQSDQIEILEGSPFASFKTGEKISLSQAQLLAPCEPSKIICVGLNYKDHIQELKLSTPAEPMIFAKATSALNGPHQAIVLPSCSQQVEFEGELAVVIGATAKNISESEVESIIFGYTCSNDVTARDLQSRDGQFFRSKSFDTFACLGPYIETQLDPSDLTLRTRLNGDVCQSSNTQQLLFSVPKIVSYISKMMTLLPGDVISTGTPSGTLPLKEGDEVEVEIEGIGALKNFATQEKKPSH